MTILIENSLTGAKEEFKPINSHKVTIYACGITPQSSSHIGHAVSAIRFAMIRKYLEFLDYKVIFVENVTDIDDKIITKSKELNIPVRQIAEQNYNEYRTLLNKLGVPRPTHEPKATEYIDKIIEYIEKLIDEGIGYLTNKGDVYFDVTKKEDYGKLSKRKLEDSLPGTRITIEDNKRNTQDFCLWKITQDGENFDSPWGWGRPGWHIECSAMSNNLLGETIDIHCGGLDLLFPHHENEIAQSEAHNHKPYVSYWVHSGLLMINNEKMSKSLNNFMTLKDGFTLYGSELLAWTILRHGYRSSIDLHNKLFADNLNKILQFYRLFESVPNLMSEGILTKYLLDQNILAEFIDVMNDNFNTPKAIVLLSEYMNSASKLKNDTDKYELRIRTLYTLGKVLGLFTRDNSKEIVNQLLHFQAHLKSLNQGISIDYIEQSLEKIKEFRKAGSFTDADQLREELSKKGVKALYDSKDNYSWQFILSS